MVPPVPSCTCVLATSTSTEPASGAGTTTLTVGVLPAAEADGGGSTTSKVTSWPEEFLKPIWSLPYTVSSCTWSGTSARNSTVTLPLETWERSA